MSMKTVRYGKIADAWRTQIAEARDPPGQSPQDG